MCFRSNAFKWLLMYSCFLALIVSSCTYNDSSEIQTIEVKLPLSDASPLPDLPIQPTRIDYLKTAKNSIPILHFGDDLELIAHPKALPFETDSLLFWAEIKEDKLVVRYIEKEQLPLRNPPDNRFMQAFSNADGYIDNFTYRKVGYASDLHFRTPFADGELLATDSSLEYSSASGWKATVKVSGPAEFIQSEGGPLLEADSNSPFQLVSLDYSLFDPHGKAVPAYGLFAYFTKQEGLITQTLMDRNAMLGDTVEAYVQDRVKTKNDSVVYWEWWLPKGIRMTGRKVPLHFRLSGKFGSEVFTGSNGGLKSMDVVSYKVSSSAAAVSDLNLGAEFLNDSTVRFHYWNLPPGTFHFEDGQSSTFLLEDFPIAVTYRRNRWFTPTITGRDSIGNYYAVKLLIQPSQ